MSLSMWQDFSKLEQHPLCALIPAMSDEEYEALRDDIKDNGLRDQIVTYEGKVLDGWHRYRALQELKGEIKPEFFSAFSPGDADGPTPEAFVLSRNLHRRHLTKEQRAILAAKKVLAQPKGNAGRPKMIQPDEMSKEELEAAMQSAESALVAEENMAPIRAPFSERPNKALIKEAAEEFKVPAKKVERAKALVNASPELAAKVEKGEMKLIEAEKQVKPRKPKPAQFRARDLEHYVVEYGNGGRGFFQLGHIIVVVATSDGARAELMKLTHKNKWPCVFEELNEERL